MCLMIVCGSVAIIFKAQPWPEGSRSIPHDGETQQRQFLRLEDRRLLAIAEMNGEARPSHLCWSGGHEIIKWKSILLNKNRSHEIVRWPWVKDAQGKVQCNSAYSWCCASLLLLLCLFFLCWVAWVVQGTDKPVHTMPLRGCCLLCIHKQRSHKT